MVSEAKDAVSMVCQVCTVTCHRDGKHRNGLRRFRCPKCRKAYTEPHQRTLGTMYISAERAALAIRLLVEGNSIRSTERITGMDRNTIMSLLVKAGEKCQALMDEKLVDLPVKDVQCDEIWGYVFKKEHHKNEDTPEYGDAYCYIGIERHTKLVLCHYLGKRNNPSTEHFVAKLALATSTFPYQLTTDGFTPYIKPVKKLLAGRVHFAQLIKVYGSPREGEQRYSPAEVKEVVPVKIMGHPKHDEICTSHIERQNLSIRMGMRRMTRLTNAFSKKWENLEAAYALWFAYYNWCRVHSSIRVTPAMQHGLTDHVWTIGELIG
jgi:transposase-like protein/IS1 family transposase